MNWKDKLKLIGDLNDIAREVDEAGEYTPQMKKRATLIWRRLKYENLKDAPLNKR